MYRNDDYYFWPRFGFFVSWLVNGSVIPSKSWLSLATCSKLELMIICTASWCWGQAASAPGCLMGGSNNCNPRNCQYQDMCNK
jgi:hypothetical protein